MNVYSIRFPGGNYYRNPNDDYNAWPMHIAKLIARNVAKKHKVTTVLVPVGTEHELLTEKEEKVQLEQFQSDYDLVLFYAHSLKSTELTTALKIHGLSEGSDSAASKRERLIAHLLKKAEG